MNKPLQLLKYNVMYKIWLVQFPIDRDCHKMIKKLLYTLSMRRTFTTPLVTDLNEYGFNNKTFTYINDQGVVFESILNIKIYFSKHLCTQLSLYCPITSSDININNINALHFYYKSNSGTITKLTINYTLSEIHYLMIHDNLPNVNLRCHYLGSQISCL